MVCALRWFSNVWKPPNAPFHGSVQERLPGYIHEQQQPHGWRGRTNPDRPGFHDTFARGHQILQTFSTSNSRVSAPQHKPVLIDTLCRVAIQRKETVQHLDITPTESVNSPKITPSLTSAAWALDERCSQICTNFVASVVAVCFFPLLSRTTLMILFTCCTTVTPPASASFRKSVHETWSPTVRSFNSRVADTDLRIKFTIFFSTAQRLHGPHHLYPWHFSHIKKYSLNLHQHRQKPEATTCPLLARRKTRKNITCKIFSRDCRCQREEKVGFTWKIRFPGCATVCGSRKTNTV